MLQEVSRTFTSLQAMVKAFPQSRIRQRKKNVVTPSAVADSAKEKCFEDTSAAVVVADSAEIRAGVAVAAAAVAIDSKDDGPTAVPEKSKTDANPVEPSALDVADQASDPKPASSDTPPDFSVSDSSDDGIVEATNAVPQAETKDATQPKVFLKPRSKSKAAPGNKNRPYRSRSGSRNRSRSGRRSRSRGGRRNRSRSGRSNRGRGGRSNPSRSGSRNRSRSRCIRSNGSRSGRGRATTVAPAVLPVAPAVLPVVMTAKVSLHQRLDEHLVPRPARACAARPDAAMPDDELAPSVDCNLMVAQWILGKQCDVQEFANKIRDCPMDFVCVTVTKSVSSKHYMFKFLDRLANATPRDGIYESLQPQSRLKPNDELLVNEVLREKVVLYLRPDVWIVVNRCKVKKVTFTESTYRSGRSQPDVNFGFASLHMNTSRQRMPTINIGVVIAHRLVHKNERAMLWQWLTQKKIAVLCGFFPKGQPARSFANTLGTCGGAVGWGPCIQEVCVKDRSRGPMVTKTHPSYIMCFGFCDGMRWPGEGSNMPDDFLGPDILSELITVEEYPSWEENWIGSDAVPNLGLIQQKMQNLNMWCRHSFQNCVWLGTAIPSKKKASCSGTAGTC